MLSLSFQQRKFEATNVMRTCDQGDGRDPGFRRQGNVDQVAGVWLDDILITLIVVIIIIAITIVIILIVVSIITIIAIVITLIAIAHIINVHQVAGA